MDDKAQKELNSIIDGFKPSDRDYIANLPEYNVIMLHHGLGTGIRNQFRHGKLVELFRWAKSVIPPDAKHIDDLSWPVLVEVWKAIKEGAGNPLVSSSLAYNYHKPHKQMIQEAALRGDAHAQFLLGSSYAIGFFGHHVDESKKDVVEAVFWLSLGAREHQNPIAVARRDEYIAKLTPSQKAEVERRVAEWKPLTAP